MGIQGKKGWGGCLFRGPSNKDPGSTLIEVRDIQKLPSQGRQSHDEQSPLRVPMWYDSQIYPETLVS